MRQKTHPPRGDSAEYRSLFHIAHLCNSCCCPHYITENVEKQGAPRQLCLPKTEKHLPDPISGFFAIFFPKFPVGEGHCSSLLGELCPTLPGVRRRLCFRHRRRSPAHLAKYMRTCLRARKSERRPGTNKKHTRLGVFFIWNPATSYSPGPSPAKYHRR